MLWLSQGHAASRAQHVPSIVSVRCSLPCGAASIFLRSRKAHQPQGAGLGTSGTSMARALCTEISGDGVGFFIPSTALLARQELPKASLAHYIAAHLLLPTANKHTSQFIYCFPLSNPPPLPVLSNRRLIRVQTWGVGVGQPQLQPHLGCDGAGATDSTQSPAMELPLRTLALMDRAVFFSLLFTLYCSCFCTGKRCWSAQKSFRSRLAAELCLIIVIIWKQVMGIFPMLI